MTAGRVHRLSAIHFALNVEPGIDIAGYGKAQFDPIHLSESKFNMRKTVGDFFVERLYEWGVSRICGYPGDGINGVLGALDCAKHKIEFIQVRREEMAAFMASAYAKFTGELGVCLSTGGPGALHLITGLYDAEMDHMPVLACGRPSMKKSAGTRGRVHPSLTIQAMACRIGYRIRRLASRGDL